MTDGGWTSDQGIKSAAIAIAIVAAGLMALGVMVDGLEWVGRETGYDGSPTWWGGAYLVGGLIVGGIGGFIAFAAAWFWCASEGRFWGFAVGWAPSAILGWLIGLLLIPLWLPVLVFFGWKILRG